MLRRCLRISSRDIKIAVTTMAFSPYNSLSLRIKQQGLHSSHSTCQLMCTSKNSIRLSSTLERSTMLPPIEGLNRAREASGNRISGNAFFSPCLFLTSVVFPMFPVAGACIRCQKGRHHLSSIFLVILRVRVSRLLSSSHSIFLFL